MEDMKLHGGLPNEYTSVQRNFRAIVLRLRVPRNLYGEWPETAARFRVHSCLPVDSLLFFIIHGTEKSRLSWRILRPGNPTAARPAFAAVIDNLTSWQTEGVIGMKHLTECNA